jgi:hypothetical protein
MFPGHTCQIGLVHHDLWQSDIGTAAYNNESSYARQNSASIEFKKSLKIACIASETDVDGTECAGSIKHLYYMYFVVKSNVTLFLKKIYDVFQAQFHAWLLMIFKLCRGVLT